jgi:hypothetical protein
LITAGRSVASSQRSRIRAMTRHESLF